MVIDKNFNYQLPLCAYFDKENGKINDLRTGNGLLPEYKRLIQLQELLLELIGWGEDEILKINQELLDKYKEPDWVKDFDALQKRGFIKPKPIYGHIYVIESQGYHKIGRAKFIKDRLKQYKTENPLPITILCQIPVTDYINAEIFLLKQFEDKKFRGEWYQLTQEDINNIPNLLKKYATS